MTIEILNPGALSLLQDRGRFGFAHLGMSNGGPMDPQAAVLANRLLGNQPGATLIENTFGGLCLTAHQTTQIAVTGAPLTITVDDEPRPMWSCISLTKGSQLRLGYSKRGCRSYLAVRGGFHIDTHFGSAATVVREGIGGLDGGPLKPGDLLSVENCRPCEPRQLPAKHQPRYGSSATLRLIPGYQNRDFPEAELERFFGSEYRVSSLSDRMGYRLEGASISPGPTTLFSEGIAPGSVQVPPDGQPIVLLCDRQTIGGYPKLGAVLSLDCAALGQLRPGDSVHFARINLDTARRALAMAARFEQSRRLESFAS